MTIVALTSTTTSQGTVTLSSASAWDAPSIDPKLLGTDFDQFNLGSAIKAAFEYVSAPAWSDYIIAPYGDTAGLTTDDAIDAYMAESAVNIYHPVGTCAMSATDSTSGVVNPDLTVKNTAGLRVVDASVIVSSP